MSASTTLSLQVVTYDAAIDTNPLFNAALSVGPTGALQPTLYRAYVTTSNVTLPTPDPSCLNILVRNSNTASPVVFNATSFVTAYSGGGNTSGAVGVVIPPGACAILPYSAQVGGTLTVQPANSTVLALVSTWQATSAANAASVDVYYF